MECNLRGTCTFTVLVRPMIYLYLKIGLTSTIISPACNTNYHNNFSVHNGVRTYYSGTPKYILIGEHQYVEDKVIKLWIGQMLLGW